MSYYKTSTEYHDALDRREAQERAEQAERELNAIELTEKIDSEIAKAKKTLAESESLLKKWKAEDKEMKADARERADLYTMGMGG